MGQVTGAWFDKPEGGLESLMVSDAGKSSTNAALAEPFWIWGDAHAAQGVPPSTNWIRRDLVIPTKPAEAVLYLQVDNSARVFLNGKRVRGADAGDWSQVAVYDLREQMNAGGTNVLVIEAVNGGEGPNPAGLLAYVRLRVPGELPKSNSAQSKKIAVTVIGDVASDARWLVSKEKPAGWPAVTGTEGWAKASVLGPETIGPWNLQPTLASTANGKVVFGEVRSALASADPLLMALGRPNREQITTGRQTVATTLQALELTNGETLSRLLGRGAENLTARHPKGRALVEHVFVQALGRTPTRKEREASLELVGDKPRKEGVEDLLWSVAMLPEFQFIR